MTTITENNAIIEYTKQIATLIYIYGYAPMTQQSSMAYDLANKAPINTLYYSESVSSGSNQIFSGSNADCLYTTAWLDLSNTPIFLTTPDTRKQTAWYTIQLIDMYTNTIRNLPGVDKNNKTKIYLLIGPNASIEKYQKHPNVPQGIEIIQSPTNITYLVARVAIIGYDTDATLDIMKQIKLEIMYPDASVLDVESYSLDIFTTPQFFRELLKIMKYNQPPIKESVLINLFKSIGLDPNVDFDPNNESVEIQQALQDAIDIALQEIIPYGYMYGMWNLTKNFWMGGTTVGMYNFDYLTRDFMAYGGSAGNVPIELFYLTSVQDQFGNLLDGETHKYKMHFLSDMSNYPIIQAGGMWSITLYINFDTMVQGFNLQLYENEINRYSVGTNNNDLIFNGDWSLDIYIQNEAPTDPLIYSNWLPCPKGPFRLIFRTYSSTVTQIQNPNIPTIDYND